MLMACKYAATLAMITAASTRRAPIVAQTLRVGGAVVTVPVNHVGSLGRAPLVGTQVVAAPLAQDTALAVVAWQKKVAGGVILQGSACQ